MIKLVSVKRDKDEMSKDKAKERLLQFESIQAPQATDEELFEGLDNLIEELLANNEPLTNKAVNKLLQFRNYLILHLGAEHKSNQKSEEE